jgi:glucose-6-phosphate 1-epimerase
VRVRFALEASAATRVLWPHEFELQLEVRLEARMLELALEARNPRSDGAPLSFTSALHTYFAAAAERVRVQGLRGLEFVDKVRPRKEIEIEIEIEREAQERRSTSDVAQTQGGRRGREEREEVALEGEVDRVYERVPRRLVLREQPDPGQRERGWSLETSEELPDAVLWNAGAERARAIADMAPGDHARYVCLESARIAQPVRLEPGASWAAHLRIQPL